MGFTFPFTFRNKSCFCQAFIDTTEYPCFIFTILQDKHLIEEFGEEVTIKTDCVDVLTKKDDYPALMQLRSAIFSAIKQKNHKKFSVFIAHQMADR